MQLKAGGVGAQAAQVKLLASCTFHVHVSVKKNGSIEMQLFLSSLALFYPAGCNAVTLMTELVRAKKEG